MTEADAQLHNNQVNNRPGEHHFIIEVDGIAIGKIRVSRMNGEAHIYGFSVLPEFQGKATVGKHYGTL